MLNVYMKIKVLFQKRKRKKKIKAKDLLWCWRADSHQSLALPTFLKHNQNKIGPVDSN